MTTQLLKPAIPGNAFLKMGMYGITGTGKSFTSSKVAIGLSDYIESEKPIGYFDTEPGTDYLIPLFKKHNKELIVIKSRAFIDLLAVVREAEQKCDILIIDSITHPWQEECKAFMKRKNISVVSIRHWKELKHIWWQFTDLYTTSNLHIIMCGRSADIWEQVIAEDGVRESQKVDTKMKTETDTGYESSLLVEMLIGREGGDLGGRQVRKGRVNKDRFDVIDGCLFTNPAFKDFLPHIALLRIGQRHETVDLTRTSEELFEGKKDGHAMYIKAQNLLEGIKNEIWLIHSGQSEKSKKDRLALLEAVFGTNIMGEVEQMNLETLAAGFSSLKLTRTSPPKLIQPLKPGEAPLTDLCEEIKAGHEEEMKKGAESTLKTPKKKGKKKNAAS